MSSLAKYSKKRRFKRTPEPKPKVKASRSGSLFVVQKHRASHLHYDLRLESEGVLKSWAVPKGPSPNPSIKRLAVTVEDHPLEYANFEGTIPEGEYGGGTVMIWDRGVYIPQNGDISAGLKNGELKFALKGKKLKGSWVLVRTKGRNWLLIKHRDRYASEADFTTSASTSVVTGRTLAEIAREAGGDVENAETGDPPKKKRQPRVSRSPGATKRRAARGVLK